MNIAIMLYKMSITTIYGPMYAGKTEQYCHFMRRKVISGKKCLSIKHPIDNRYTPDAKIISHCGSEYSTGIGDIIIESDLSKINVDNYDVIGIDEAQFFNNVVKNIELWAKQDKTVLCAGLLTDSNFKLFGEMPEIIACSERVIHLLAICFNCGSENALFNIRIEKAPSEKLIDVNATYESFCRKCKNNLN